MLRSAVAACGGRVLMVMLTGMGHDGLAATRQLIGAGGTAIAQDEATSVVWGMPGAIAQAGLCHQVLPLPAIAPASSNWCGQRGDETAIFRHARRAAARTGSGLVIGQDKLYLLETRLAPILKQQGLRDLDALADRVRPGGAGELERQVIEAMTTNESFLLPRQQAVHAFPQLRPCRDCKPRGRRRRNLRIWSAASSSGQEAYSLAMILAECRASLNGRSVEIIGTDISREQIAARTRRRLYTQFEVQRGLPIQLLMKYFQKDGTNWRI